MLQQQLDFSVLPKVWKHTIIIPIPKPNKDKTKLTSYRPIALTSVFCKIFERILAHRITHFLTSQKKLNPNQHGFLPFRDNHAAIYKIYSAISEAQKNKKFFVAVSLDIKSAYDSVHVDDLILKCLQLETHLKACNVIQTTSLRIALGVPIWTPNVILLKLAGQEILSEEIKRTYSHLVEKDAESLRITFCNLNCIPDHIISHPIFPHSSPNVCEIFLKDFYFQNKELPSSIISSDFLEYLQRFFPNHFIIATDGSKSHCYTSIAGFSCLQQFCYRIHPLNSVFTAEILAICQALDELVVPEKDILILSDSFSALSSLKNISFHSPKVIQRLAAKIHIRKCLNQNIAFLWIPGHSGVSWNEKADAIAKQVSDFSPYIDWIASEDIFSHLKKQSFQTTEENYHKSKYQLLIGNIPDILTISKWTGNRVQDRLIARIISKTITTPGLLYRFNLHPDPLCRVCNEINDISHILLKCQKYASVRVILWRKLNIISANITYDVLLSQVLANKNQLLIFVQTLKYFDID
ncbi:hypothetical protein AVEN_52792-1 [Araneus ventricosus]|uniref:RNase H type-1 domain-containing protein n=1 Tax=Araneus ventricosus TaxID=182803 RepID=A0A4Y2CW97_ARAVE|nr:hypothetical protein AVEN_52792-1 [Araneus ventricosus]